MTSKRGPRSAALAQKQNALAVRARDGDAAALRELLDSMRPYMRTMVQKYGSPSVDREDLFQCCRIGVLRAVRVFDPDRGDIASVASTFIRGELANHIDLMMRPVKVPKSRLMRGVQWKVMPRMRALMAAGAYEQEAMEQACAEFDVPVEEVRVYMAAAAPVQVVETQDEDGGGGHTLSHEPNPMGGLEDEDRAFALEVLRGALTEREFFMLTARLVEDRTLDSIAAEMGVSRQSVKQGLLSAVVKARQALEEEDLVPEVLL